jgi:phage tail protein X
MASTYTTVQGDTWDNIALAVYGDESYAYYLMQQNYDELDTLVFSDGTVLNTPELPEELDGDLPPWITDGEDDGDDPYDE